jgi:hypothetical protein
MAGTWKIGLGRKKSCEEARQDRKPRKWHPSREPLARETEGLEPSRDRRGEEAYVRLRLAALCTERKSLALI